MSERQGIANDLESVRTQTVRVTIANANDLAKRREIYDRFLRAYRDVIDFMYADQKAIDAKCRKRSKARDHLLTRVRTHELSEKFG